MTRGYVAEREVVLRTVIGADAARECARRDVLRFVAFVFTWLVAIPAGVWAATSDRPASWAVAGTAVALDLAILAMSFTLGQQAIAHANRFVGKRLGYPVELGANMGPGEWQTAVEREQRFHRQGHRPRFFLDPPR